MLPGPDLDPEPDPADPADPAIRSTPTRPADATVTGIRALVARGKGTVTAGQARANELLEKYQDRPLLDVGLRIYQRDRESAGTVVGSALAFRLFLFFIPLLLFVVGLAGFVAERRRRGRRHQRRRDGQPGPPDQRGADPAQQHAVDRRRPRVRRHDHRRAAR